MVEALRGEAIKRKSLNEGSHTSGYYEENSGHSMERESDGSVGGTRQLARYLTEKVTQEDWAEIVNALVISAKEGNASAARLLLSARFGAKRWLSSVSEESDNVNRRK